MIDNMNIPSMGSLVILRSGGPIMTVDFIEPTNSSIVHTVWFVNDEVKRGSFDIDHITRIR